MKAQRHSFTIKGFTDGCYQLSALALYGNLAQESAKGDARRVY
jgi:hypothetical protein